MRLPINGTFACLFPALTAFAWDTPLPSLVQPSGTDLAAFGNPAAAARSEEAGTAFALGEPDSLGGTHWERAWSFHHQAPGFAFGARLWEGGAKTDAEFGWTSAAETAEWLAPGARVAWRAREDNPDRLGLDGGLQLRPHPTFLAGYWGENLWTTGTALQVHRWSLGVKPFAGAAGFAAPLSLGVGVEFPDSGPRRDLLYAQVPLPLSLLAQARWDWNAQTVSVGLGLQATGQLAAAFGLSAPAAGPRRDIPSLPEAALRYRTHRRTPYLLGHGRVADLDLNHDFAEGEAVTSWIFADGEYSYLKLRRQLDLLEADPRIGAVVIRLGRARTGWGMGEEIRGRLLGLRSRGKRLVAYLEEVTPLNYYLASAADVVAVQPGGHFAVTGFSSEVMFYRGFFEKVGVEAQFLRHGRYKSFQEPYTRENLSPESRANLESYLASSWGYFLEAVASGRRLPRDSVAKALASGDINLDHALRAGLIDTLVDQDQLKELAGGRRASWVRVTGEGVDHRDWEIRPRIALVVVSGNMVMGRSAPGWLASPELAGARSVADQLRRARLDPDIKAVVLRMDSPGGAAQAADIMSREVELLRKAGKPVVASVGHVAASGGYYVVCGADRIYSARNSVLGSIGIVWGKFVMRGLQGKLGLTTETVKTTPHADAQSFSRPWDSAEVAIIQRHMDQFYDRFTAKVAAGRKLSRQRVDSLAQGRIYTGTQAVGNGLVDSIGGLDAALREAARLAGIPASRRTELVVIPARSGLGWTGEGRAHGAAEGSAGWTDWTPWAGDDGRGGLARALRALEDRYASLTEAQLWALSPELSGWSPPRPE